MVEPFTKALYKKASNKTITKKDLSIFIEVIKEVLRPEKSSNQGNQ